tara:strand:+ start:736 stop:1890 length:1155 start_codon:yes stop_codon:yes gene_type:complete
MCKIRVDVNGTSANYRYTAQLQALVNGVPVDSMSGGYIRASSASFNTSIDLDSVLELTAGDTLSYQIKRISNLTGNAVTVANQCTIDIISLTGGGSSGGGTGPAGPTGPEGPKGDDGDQGIQGIQGVPGTDGTDGVDGSQGIQGEPGVEGDPGTNGTNGTNGANGAPGSNGTDGNRWFSGNGVPNNAIGNQGDYYLDGLTGDIYIKTGLGWTLSGENIMGPAGPQGPAGTGGGTGGGGIAAYAQFEATSGTVLDGIAASNVPQFPTAFDTPTITKGTWSEIPSIGWLVPVDGVYECTFMFQAMIDPTKTRSSLGGFFTQGGNQSGNGISNYSRDDQGVMYCQGTRLFNLVAGDIIGYKLYKTAASSTLVIAGSAQSTFIIKQID